MPVQYSSIIDEHRAVRERVGLFDLSHMGELYVEGPEAGLALASALVSDPPALAIGRAQYSMICAADGGIIDDLIVYRLGEERFLVVANAGNAAIVSDALAERLAGFKAVLDDRSLATGLLAVQGPLAAEVLGAADRRRPDGAALLRRRPRGRSPASRRSSRGPATRARTGSRSSSRRPPRRSCGTRCSRRSALPAAVRSDSGARDTLRLEAGHAALRQRARPRDEPRTKPGSAASSSSPSRRLRRSRGPREGRGGRARPASRRA